MAIPRIIPVLLMKNKGLYKGVRFKNHIYVGDPINAVKIFNEKQVDELIILGIDHSVNKTVPQTDYIRDIVSEAFIPLAYGGGIRTLEQARQIFKAGVEKIIVNTEAFLNPSFIKNLAEEFGSQSIVVCLDIKKGILGTEACYIHCGTKKVKGTPLEWALRFEENGAGEIILQSVDRDGTGKGYDIDLLKRIASHLSIPVVIAGGASSIDDFALALQNGAHACAAGSMFVFKGALKGVLISYPSPEELKTLSDFAKIS